jgi:polygalacturonase
MLRSLLAVIALVQSVFAFEKYYSIMDYGAIPHDEDSWDTEWINTNAFRLALEAATNNTYGTHIVHIPEGYWFSMFPVEVEWLTDITIQIDGVIKASKRHTRYPVSWELRGDGSWRQRVSNFMQFDHANRILFKGKGMVDGQGFMWWMREYIVNNPGGRPHLIEMYHSEDVEFTGITWKNSPQYNINVRDINRFYFHDFTIDTDILGQFVIGQFFGQHDSMRDGFPLPTFPLNTDGIDPAGSNVLIERVNIINFDDAVAVKPQHNDGEKATCSENIMVRNCNITYGVGMTIGSVPPSNNYACVRTVTFINHTFYHPFKAIYVKTNPGHTDSMLPGSGGEITNIRYENIEIHYPIWWSIYIGPQQQKQPDGAGPGCMFYPFGGCETQPLITVDNIVLKNV